MDSFGEKALLYNCPRAATVAATSDGLLWAVDRVTFRHMIAHTSEDNIAAVVTALRTVPILSSLTEEQLSKVAAAVKVCTRCCKCCVSSRAACHCCTCRGSLAEHGVNHELQLTDYHAGETIIRKGDHGDTFFMIKSGAVVCTDIISRGEAIDDLALGPGDFFGERALLMSEPRAANVVATSDTVRDSLCAPRSAAASVG